MNLNALMNVAVGILNICVLEVETEYHLTAVDQILAFDS